MSRWDRSSVARKIKPGTCDLREDETHKIENVL